MTVVKRLIPFLALFLAIMWVLSAYVVEEIYERYEAPLRAASGSRPAFLILGDSRAEKIEEATLGPGFMNLAHASDGAQDMHAKLRFLVRAGAHPGVVLLQCDWHMFSGYRAHMNNRSRGLAISSYDDSVSAYRCPLIEYVVNRYVVRWIPLLDPGNADIFQSKLSASLFGETGGPQNWTAVAGTGRWDAMPPDRARARVNWRYSQLFSEPWTPEYARAMVELVRFCRENDIRVIGLRYPVAPSLKAMIDATDLTQIRSFYEALGIEILDFTRAFSDPTLFQDQDHLNPTGVDVYSRILRDLVQRPRPG